MAKEVDYNENFDNVVAQDRATMIREAAKKNKQENKEKDALQTASAMSGEATKKVLDKLFLSINNSIWGLTVILLPLLGLTLLMSLLLVLALLLKKFIAGHLEEKGISIKISFLIQIYTWGTLFVQLLLTVIVYSIIYIILNPVEFGIAALGL